MKTNTNKTNKKIILLTNYRNVNHSKVKSSLANSLFVQLFTFKLNFLKVSCLSKETKQTEYIFSPTGGQPHKVSSCWLNNGLGH